MTLFVAQPFRRRCPHPAGILSLVLTLLPALRAQAGAGALRGVVADDLDHPVAGATIAVRGTFVAHATSRTTGEFELLLPYGEYRVGVGGSDFTVYVSPVRPVCVKIAPHDAGVVSCPGDAHPWSARPNAPAQSIAGLLLAYEPTAVTEPLDFSGPVSTPSPLLSQRAFSWTGVRYTLQGVDTTDPYQPGRTDALLDTSGIQEVAVRTGFDLGASRAYGSEVAAFVTTSRTAWHGAVASSDTGSFLASNNLPGAATHGLLQQVGKYRRFSNDSLQVGGPLGRRIDGFASLAGQWSSQTVPLAPVGSALERRLLLGSAIVRAQLTARDQLQFDLAGSRARQPDWGMPAGVEAWAGRRMGPPFTIAGIEGFAGCPENDGFDSFQAVWNRLAAGVLWQVRYAASSAHLDTTSNAPAGAQSVIDLVSGATNGVTPLTNLGTRTRQTVAASHERAHLEIGKSRHTLTVGAEWDRAGVRNRFGAPSELNLITASGAPAFVVVLNTPQDSRQGVTNLSAHARDAITLQPWLTLDLAVVADLARGGAIAWNSVSPRAGFALTPGGFRRLTLRASYARLYAPLAGRYLDFGDPNSLGGLEYQWIDGNHDGRYQPGEMGPLLMRFGGPYSSIDAALRPPHADEFNLGAGISLPWKTSARTWFFRRDEKNRIAAVDLGVPSSAYLPVQVDDPGPDGLPGTFDDQLLTVYAQQPASFGRDRYLLTNPPGLRTLAEGMVAEAGSQWRDYTVHASFMAVKSTGPANSGNSPLENDPGVIGSLFSDPNASINAAGRQFFDRAYVGKAQFLGKLPRFLGGIQWENTVNYMDGAAFARQLLVTGLPQGPILVDATVRGSPGGGNRAEHVMNWNLRLCRAFPMAHGTAKLALDVANVMNSDHRIREVETSGPTFNQRLPIAIEPARFLRICIQYAF